MKYSRLVARDLSELEEDEEEEAEAEEEEEEEDEPDDVDVVNCAISSIIPAICCLNILLSGTIKLAIDCC